MPGRLYLKSAVTVPPRDEIHATVELRGALPLWLQPGMTVEVEPGAEYRQQTGPVLVVAIYCYMLLFTVTAVAMPVPTEL